MARFRCAWCNKEYPKSQAKWRTTDPDDPRCTKRYCVACARKGDHRRVMRSRLFDLPPGIIHRAKYDQESDDFIYAGCDAARVDRIKRQRDELEKQGFLYRPAEHAHDHNFTKEEKKANEDARREYRLQHKGKPRFQSNAQRKKTKKEERQEQLLNDAWERKAERECDNLFSRWREKYEGQSDSD